MPLCHNLKEIIEREIKRISQIQLTAAAKELSQRYRDPDRDHIPTFMISEAHRLAYLAVRLPATYAVVQDVLREIKKRVPHVKIENVLDIGAGPGTASWAASEEFPELQRIDLLEQDIDLLAIGNRMMQEAANKALKSATWHQGRELQASEGMKSDLVIMSYVVGEIPSDHLSTFIADGWKATEQLMVVIEPGTPHGFERIRSIRQQLIDCGAYIIAPCPHMHACPMTHSDWCHFSVRLERPRFHMDVKNVSLGYEDEKYSYVIAARFPANLPEGRILRHPQKHTGHINLTLCTSHGLEQRVISRRHGDVYKQARKLEWGDPFPS